ncbi:GWT1-domain-containing protein [Crassisporium funariophilum]|nr:GWT1-domain-containing protein [Crassisporium funariophilum]
MGEYKAEKEAFVSGMTGSSITHINLISLVALAAVALYASIRTRLPPSYAIGFLSSWALLVLPMLLAMTLFASHPIYLVILLLIPTALLLRIPKAETGTPLPSSQPPSPSVHAHVHRPSVRIQPLPALTTYRAHMMLMTVLAILAVDFPIFPRSLAKCETFGVSLMDLGVGSFVFSQGIVSAIPLIRDAGYITAPAWPKLLEVTKKSLPIIGLGLIRVLLVKGTEYPEHETEYGRHWNFFITLALLPIIQVMLHPLLLRLPISFVGVIIGIAQQIALSHFALKEYVLTAPRTSLISANKEGLVSLLGYLAIHLLGLSAGTLILPPSPSFFARRLRTLASHRNRNTSKTKTKKRRNSDPVVPEPEKEKEKEFNSDLGAPRQRGKTATELCAYAIVWWASLGLTRLLKVDGTWGAEGGVSRRMVNLPYILWVAGFNTSFLLAYMVVLDIGIFASPQPRSPQHLKPGNKTLALSVEPQLQLPPAPPDSAQDNPPRLLALINQYGLLIFLLANVLTGLVNVTIPTMYTGDFWALGILGGYAGVVGAVPWVAAGWRGKGEREE